jgi:hypothetical protein
MLHKRGHSVFSLPRGEGGEAQSAEPGGATPGETRGCPHAWFLASRRTTLPSGEGSSRCGETPRLFSPTLRQWLTLAAALVLALGYALYLRYRVIEQAWVALSCQDGAKTFLCISRNATTALFKNNAFGIVAMAAAALNLIRPTPVRLGIGIAAAAFGIVLYNIGASGLAIAMLLIGFARPASGGA